MRGFNAVTIGAAILLSTLALSGTRSLADPRVADLVQAGKIRLALFLPLYTKDAASGELRGVTTGIVSIDLMRAFAARLGVEVQLAGYPTPPEVVACLKSGTCDVGIMGVTPGRAAEVGLSPPFLQFDYTFLVPAGSSILNLADADRPGIRIAVVRNHASTLALSRLLKDAEQVEADTPDAAFDLLRSKRADAFASARGTLLDYAPDLPGARVLDERYEVNLVAMAVPKGHAGRLAALSEFVEEAKSSGLIAQSIERAGLRGAMQVAPPHKYD
jgi:polar amino acid transport system substrate-binding protein